MKKINIYPGKNGSAMLIALGVIATIASIFIMLFGHNINADGNKGPLIFGLLLGMVVNEINVIRSYKKSIKIRRYKSLKREVMFFAGFSIMAIVIIVFVPSGITAIGILSAMFSGSILASIVYKTIKKIPSLILMEDSFIDKTTISSIGEVKYSEIRDLFIYTNAGNRLLVIIVDDIKGKIQKLNIIKRIICIGKEHIEIPYNRVELPLEELENIIRKNASLEEVG